MATEKWLTLQEIPGVRYVEHETRPRVPGVKSRGLDRRFQLRFMVKGKRCSIGLGWESKGWKLSKVVEFRDMFMQNIKTGEGPQNMKEYRAINTEEREARQQHKAKRQLAATTVQKFFDEKYYPRAQADKTEKTWTREEGMFRLHIAPVIGDMPLKKISEPTLWGIKDRMLKADRSHRTVEYVFALVRQIFNHAVMLGYVDKSPVPKGLRKTLKLKIKNSRERFLTREEAATLLEALLKKSEQLWRIALLSLHSGMRAGECFDLQWGRVDLENNRIKVFDGKGHDRIVPMSKDVREMFEEMEPGKQQELVFPSKTGGRIGQISKAYSLTVHDLGFNGEEGDEIKDNRDRVCFHTLRHTFASWLAQSGKIDLYRLQKLMGHQSIAMTERYAHLMPEQDSIMAVFDDQHGGDNTGKVVEFRR